MEAAAEMPRYRCHKEVWALKIAAVIIDDHDSYSTGHGATIVPEDRRYAPLRVDYEYLRKHDPKPGGYYVVYDDGYASWSPAKAFEEGYALVG